VRGHQDLGLALGIGPGELLGFVEQAQLIAGASLTALAEVLALEQPDILAKLLDLEVALFDRSVALMDRSVAFEQESLQALDIVWNRCPLTHEVETNK
jgi:hypothetical protein